MKVRLVAPINVLRPVRRAMHFPRRTMAELARLDPASQRRMLKRRRMRPHGHDLLELKCGHVVVRVCTQPGPTLWRPQICETCTRRERERQAQYAKVDERLTKRTHMLVEEAVMAKSAAAVKGKSKGKSTKRTIENKGWGQVYTYVKALKLEPTKETIIGCVYSGLKKIKKGTVAEVMDAAMKEGLNKVTGQDPKVQTQIMLRRIVEAGSAKVERPDADAEPTPKKLTVKRAKPKAKPVKARDEDEGDEDVDDDSDSDSE